MNTLKFICRLPGVPFILRSSFELNDSRLERNILGLTFKNPVGLAAGFDKDAELIDELEYFGFGFIEIGTLTPKPQIGNPKPRMFRLEADKALINRMGFNNAGVLDAVNRLKKKHETIIIGGNIGKNTSTENRYAFRDYEYCFEALYDYVDYFVINVSSPNTPELRELQDKAPLKELLTRVKQRSIEKNSRKPILLKIAPDLSDDQLDDIVEILKETNMDGVIATNTTINRENLRTSKQVIDDLGFGGLSGCPLNDESNRVIRFLRIQLGPDFPIIGVGGIMSPTDALEKIEAGASLIQVYTGFIYNGPSFVKQINKAILNAKQ